jgi:hypothetical protein
LVKKVKLKIVVHCAKIIVAKPVLNLLSTAPAKPIAAH